MGAELVILVVGVTSLGAYVYGRLGLDLQDRALWTASRGALACLGVGLAFLALNLVIGFVATLALRLVLHEFVSLYVINDVTLVYVSLIQGLVFRLWWWRRRVSECPPGPPG